MTEQVSEFCRQIEAYLCKKNDGHLIRVTGPSFDLVSRWAEQGIPIKVAFGGIDRYFERYYRSGPRRRPVKIDFCEADVLDLFDEWRRAVGIGRRSSSVVRRPSSVVRRPSSVVGQASSVDGQASSVDGQASSVDGQASSVVGQVAGVVGQVAGVVGHPSSRVSLPEHLERVVTRLTSAKASGTIDDGFDSIIDAVSRELDLARARAGGLRGEARAQALTRLGDLDRAMVALARTRVDAAAMASIVNEADRDLAPFKSGMTADAYGRAKDAAVGELVRAHFRLPAIVFE